MGYTVYNIWEDDIYDEIKLENWLRRVFNWTTSAGIGENVSGNIEGIVSGEDEGDRELFLEALLRFEDVLGKI